MHLGVAQLVARYLGVVEAASSSLVTQTRKRESYDSRFSFIHQGFPHFWVRIFLCPNFFKIGEFWIWYRIWYNVSKSVFQKRVEAVSKFKILKGKTLWQTLHPKATEPTVMDCLRHEKQGDSIHDAKRQIITDGKRFAQSNAKALMTNDFVIISAFF